MEFQLLNDRLIAFLDILGFSELLRSLPLDQVIRTYSALIEEANNHVFEGMLTGPETAKRSENFAYSTFVFDSIVLVSHELTDITNTNKFVFATTLLMELAFRKRLPLRGAVAIGDVAVNSEYPLILSPEFPSLRMMEKEQEWAGAILHDSAAPAVVDAMFGNAPSQPRGSDPIINYPVPFKSGPRTMWTLNWVNLLDDGDLETGLDYLNSIKRAPTNSYAESVRSLPMAIQRLPQIIQGAEFARLLVSRSMFRPKFFDSDGRHVAVKGGVPYIAVGEPRD